MGCCLTIVDPQEEELENYYRTVTPDIALQSLHNYLLQHQAQDDRYEAIFDACSVQGSPQEQPYWTKESLQNHILKAHPEVKLPDTAIDVLWSCFYFYAWHPFPRSDADTGRIERPAFERALILLAYKVTGILGTILSGMTQAKVHWAYVNGRSCTCRHNIDRIFRSISHVHTNVQQSSNNSQSYLEDDILDIVATTQPHKTKGIPGYETLSPTAQRLLQSKGANYQSQLHSRSLTTLLSLLHRIRLYTSTWGRDNFHHGTLEEPSARQDELVNVLVQPFNLDGEGFLTSSAISRCFDLLPNIELRFHELWAIIFQPPIPENSSALGTEPLPDSRICDILRAVSLFVPPAKEFHGKPELAREIRPVSFETISLSTMKDSSDGLTLARIIESVADRGYEHHPHLLLFFEDETQSRSRFQGAIGAYYSATANQKTSEEGDTSGKTEISNNIAPRLSLPQTLFQLQPDFSLFRLEKAENFSQSSLNRLSDMHKNISPSEYWIGGLEKSEVGLKIDPVSKRATFMVNQVAANQNQAMYKDVIKYVNNKEDLGDDESEGIRASFTVGHVGIYRVDGGDEFKPWKSNEDGVIRRI